MEYISYFTLLCSLQSIPHEIRRFVTSQNGNWIHNITIFDKYMSYWWYHCFIDQYVIVLNANLQFVQINPFHAVHVCRLNYHWLLCMLSGRRHDILNLLPILIVFCPLVNQVFNIMKIRLLHVYLLSIPQSIVKSFSCRRYVKLSAPWPLNQNGGRVWPWIVQQTGQGFKRW